MLAFKYAKHSTPLAHAISLKHLSQANIALAGGAGSGSKHLRHTQTHINNSTSSEA
jgi:hypothetical protein